MSHRRLAAVSAFALASALASALGPAIAGAQTVRGTVVSTHDGAAIAAASILTAQGRLVVRSDARGHFVLRDHADSLIIRALGYRECRIGRFSTDTIIALEPVALLLDRVTTTVGQRAIKLSESSASVDVLSRADIDGAAAVSVSQALRTVPGLQEIASPPSKTTMAIRGLDGARVLVLVDGEPVPGALIETRDIGRLSTLSAERIEVTRGPSSVEFGSDALGGVINLVTAPPAKDFMGTATARVGELGRREATGELSNTHGAFGYRVGGGWRQVDRLASVDAAGSSLERVYDVRADARYRASERWRLRTDVQLSQERQRWPVGGGYNGFIDNHAAQALTEAQLTTARGLLRIRAFGQYFDYQFRQSQQRVPIAGSADSLEQREHLLRGLVSYATVLGAHTVDVGAQVSARAIVAPGKIDNDRADDRVTEVFARDAWTRGPVLVTAGARSTSSSLWGHSLNPSIGATWQLASAFRARVNLARGFRAPSFKEIRYTFTNPAAGYVIVGNADLDAERSMNVEAGLDWTPTRTVLIETGAYRTSVRNLIDTRFTGTNAAGLQIYQNLNVARAHITGAELSASVEAGGGTLSGGYNFLRARDVETGKTLDRRAAHSVNAAYERNLSDVVDRLSGRWSVRMSYLSRAPIGDAIQDERVSVDVHGTLDVSDRIELSVGANNIFDQRPAGWTPAFQRQFFAGVKLRAGSVDRR